MKRGGWLLALCFATVAHAQYYRWVDEQGKTHYGDRLPPTAAGKAQEIRYGAPVADKQFPYAVREAIANFPVTLYVTADCAQGCRDGRDYLKLRGIPFSEKNVGTQEEIESLKKLSDGEAVVPVLTVGAKTAKGWLQSDWQRLLDAAGYPKAPAR